MDIVLLVLVVIGSFLFYKRKVKKEALIKKFKNGESPAIVIYALFAFGLLLLLLPYMLSHHSLIGIDATAGTIGDAVNGITAPFMAFAAIIVTFYAFWIQFKANISQTEQFDKQADDTAIQRFENKFYALIELHRKNLDEIEIRNEIIGRKAFISMFNELKYTYLRVVKFYFEKYKPSNPNLVISEDVLYNISYLIFFFGIGPNSSKMVSDLIGKTYAGFFNAVENHLTQEQITWEDNFKVSIGDEKTEGEHPDDETSIDQYRINIDFDGLNFSFRQLYKPFDGHVSRLSHYIRNVYQIVNFIDGNTEKGITAEMKQNYATTLRAQLSVYEQLVIYYNALSVLGAPWLDKNNNRLENLIEKYALVRSVPLPLADFYKRPKHIFNKTKNAYGRNLFEWDEIRERMAKL